MIKMDFMYRPAFLFLLMLPGALFAQTTYYSRATGDWNDVNTWSTTGHGGAAAAAVPGSAPDDIVLIGSGHTVRVDLSATFARMTIDDDGSGGVLAFPFTNTAGYNANYTLTLSDSLRVLSGGTITPAHPTEFGLPAGTNTARTHGLVVQGNIRNDGNIDLEGTATDRRVNLTLSGVSDVVVWGSGTWDFTNVAGALIFNKSSLTVEIENRSANFTPAGRLTWTSGHYIHNNSGTFGGITDANPWTLTNASITVTQGQVTMMTAPGGDRTITIGGTVTVTGGVLFAGSNGASNPDFVFNGAVTMSSGSILTANATPVGPVYGTDGAITFGAAGNTVSGGNLWSQTMTVNSDITFSGVGTTFWAQTLTIGTPGSVVFGQLTAQVGVNGGTDGSITLTGAAAAPRASLTVNNGATLNHYSGADNAVALGQATTLTVNNATVNIAADANDNDDALQWVSGTDASNMTTISVSNGGDLNVGTGTFGDIDDDGTGSFVSISVDGAGSTFSSYGFGSIAIVRDFSVTNGATVFVGTTNMTVSNAFTLTGNSPLTLGTDANESALTLNGTGTISGASTSLTVTDITIGADGNVTMTGGTLTMGYVTDNNADLTLTGEASAQGAVLSISNSTVTVNGTGDGTFDVFQGADLTLDNSTFTIGANLIADDYMLGIQGSASATHPTTVTIQNGADLIIGTGIFGNIDDVTVSTNLQFTATGAGTTVTSPGDANFTSSALTVTNGATVSFGSTVTTASLTLTSATLTVSSGSDETLSITSSCNISGTAPSLTANNLTIGLDASFSQSSGTVVIGDASTDLGTVILTADTGGATAGGAMTLSGGSFTVYGEESNNTFEMQTSSTLTMSGGAQLTVSPDIANNNNVFRVANGQTLVRSTTVSVTGAADVIVGTGTFGDIEENVGGENSSITVSGAGSSFIVYGTGGTLTIGDLNVSSSGVVSIASNLNLQDDFSALTSASVTIGDNVAGTLTVNGTMTVNGAATSVSILGIMTLNGTANINNGTVEIADGVTASAVTRFTIAAAATVNLNGGTLTLGPNVTGHTANSLVNVLGNFTISGGNISFVPVMTSLSGGNILSINNGTLTLNGGVILNVATSMTSMSGGNIVTMANASSLTINNGTLNIATNVGLTTIGGGGNPFNQGGTAQVYIGDGAGAANSAAFYVATGLTEELPLVNNINVYDMSGTSNVLVVDTDGLLQVGGANRGDLRITTSISNSTIDLNGGTINVTASLRFTQAGSTFSVNSGTLNIGTAASDGANSLVFLTNPASPTSFVVAGGTVNIGDGNSSVVVGNGDNNPTIISGNYHRFEMSSGTINLNGRFDMNDNAARFVMSGGAFNINPQGDQDIGGLNNVFRLYGGAAQMTGGILTILNPNPNAGGNGATTGLTLLTSRLGDGTTTGARLHNGTGGGLTSTFTGCDIRLGDGIETAAGSADGFDLLLATDFTYSNITINNPSGTNRHVTLASNPSNGTVTIPNLTITAGSFQIGTAATPTSPNAAVAGSGNFVLGAGGTLTIANTTNSTVPIGNEVNFPYGYASYTIGANSNIIYSGNGSALVGLPSGSGETIENLTLSGTGTKTITTTHAQAINGVLRLTSGTLNVGTNFTLNDGATVLRDGSDALGIIGTGTLQQANAAHTYTIEYEGASKTTQTGEWVTGGTPGLRNFYVDLTSGQTLTLNTNRTVRDLTLNSGILADGGFNLEVNRHIAGTSDASHTGTGDIEITGGSATHELSGTLNIEDLTLNDGAFDAEMQTGADLYLGGALTFTAGSLVASDGLIEFDLNATTAGTPSSTSMIRTSGLTSASGVRKTMQAGVSFTYPIGVTGKYTPAAITITAAFGSGPVTVKNIDGGEHPVTQDAGNLALKYYWAVTFSGMTSVTDATMSYQYVNTDVGGTETLYVPARYLAGANPWSITGTAVAVQENTPSAGFGTINYTNVAYLTGEYTAGESSEFNNATVQNYYSLGGAWDDVSSWSTVGYGGAAASSLPAANTPVFIGNSATITVDAGGATSVPSISLESTGILDIEVTPVTSFGTVSGTGTMRIHSSTFPTGTFTTFLSSSGGTVEYRGSGSYTIPASPTNYRNLTITGSGTTKSLPNANLTIYGNMTVSSGVTVPLSNGASGNLDIDGDLTVTGASTIFRYQNGTARSVVVDGSVTVSTSATFDVANSAAVANTLTIGSTTSGSGNLTVTNATFQMLNGTGYVNVTFTGTQDATLSVPSGGVPDPVAIFNRLIVNKGSNATPVLNVNCANTAANAFVISGSNNTASKALELQNGTFRLSDANVNGTVDGQNYSINLSTGGGDFTIPSTAGLRISGGEPVVLSDAGGDDLTLNGALTVDGTGTLIIGTVTTGLVANSIKYANTAASLTVGGTATLTVGTGIRANGVVALNYTQSGGTVTTGRYGRETAEPTFEITNHASSQFNMSGGTIIVVRGGNNDSESTQIRSTTNTVTGGTFQITSANTPTSPAQTHRIRFVSPIWNLTFPFASYNGTITAQLNDLVVLNNMTVDLGASGTLTFGNGIDLRVDGTLTQTSGTLTGSNQARTLDVNNYTQNGGTFSLLGTSVASNLNISGNFSKTAGTFTFPTTTATITFDGSSTPQTFASDANLTFNDVVINNSALNGVVQLTNCDWTILGDWTTTAGNLDAQTNTRTVSFASTTQAQTITGTTDFYNLTINNTFGTNTVTLVSGELGIRSTVGSGGTLTFTAGILDIGNNSLVIRNTDAGAISGATAARFIRMGGTTGALGVTKYYPSSSSDFTFPIGVSSDYTPARINSTNHGTSSGQFTRVKVIDAVHPVATSANVLSRYWDVDGTNWTGAYTFDTEFTYLEADIHGGGNDALYIGAYYIPVTWTQSGDIVTEGSNLISWPGLTFATADFTAGDNGGFGAVTTYYSWGPNGTIGNSFNWAAPTNNTATSPWSGAAGAFVDISASGAPSASSPVVIQRNHTLTITANSQASGSLEFDNSNGAVELVLGTTTGHNFGTVDGPGTISLETGTLPGGTFTDFYADGGVFEFTGAGAITLPAGIYQNLVISGAGTKTAGGNLTINGNLSIETGATLDLDAFTANRATPGGSFTIAGTGQLLISGTSNFPANYTTNTLASTSTVNYDASANQTITAVTYGNLTLDRALNNVCTKQFAGATVIAGNFIANPTGGADMTVQTNNHAISVGGNMTFNDIDAVLSAGTSTFTFNGTAAQTLTRQAAGSFTFNNVVINNSNGVAIAAGTTTFNVSGTLTLTTGAFGIGAGNTMAISGTVSSAAGTITGSTTSDLTLTGTGAAGTINFTGGGENIRTFTMNRTATGSVIIGTNLTIGTATTGTVTLTSGIIDMGSSTMTIARNNLDVFLSQGSTTSHIEGRLSLTYPAAGAGISRRFPIASDGIYRPVSISGSPVNAVIAVEIFNSAPTVLTKDSGLETISTIRYFRAQLLSGSMSNPSQITMFFNVGNEDESINDPADLRVGRSTNNSTWTDAGGSGSFTAKVRPGYSIKAAPEGSVTSGTSATIAADTYFVVASSTSDNPLPIELEQFSISQDADRARVVWSTLSETDHYAFRIERKWIPVSTGHAKSVLDTAWTEIYFREGTGNSYNRKEYEFLDETIDIAGTYQYRLLQMDYNGVTTIYGPWSFEFSPPDGVELLANFPNPFNPETVIPFSLSSEGRVVMQLFDLTGRKVMDLTDRSYIPGRYRILLNGSRLSSGIYLIRLQIGNEVKTRKITLLK